MKIKHIWFDKSDPAFMSECFRLWCLRSSVHPASVQTSALALWKDGLISFIIPLVAFDCYHQRLFSGSAAAVPGAPPPSQKELFK